jgi:ribosomal protein S18 acetylase RimI-like enzyme
VSAPTAPDRVRALTPDEVGAVAARVETDFGRRPADGAAVNQVLLDALDRGEYDRFRVWPDAEPVAVLYASVSGALVPAGDPAGGDALAECAERMGWRILIGDAPICGAILDAYPRGLFRRRPSSREQRFLVADHAPRGDAGLPGFRRGQVRDLDSVTDFACLLHVEDHMGPPISRSARAAVRTRMLDSLSRGETWVVERAGQVVAKLDLSLRSRRRGAQIAGVYVAAHWRGRGIGGAAVAALTARLYEEAMPTVTLHVRADNASAIAAYRRAGFRDHGAWTLAFR